MEIKETAKKYTYADYAKIDDDKRYEVIDGTVYLMSPGPVQSHQVISGELFGQLWSFLRGKLCMVFSAPFDVCLNAEGDNDRTVVQPDIIVVCDMSKLDGKRCNGAPDLIIEILSPSNRKHDMLRKFDKYLKSGVREYWIVDPEDKFITVYILKEGKYIARVYGEENEDEFVPVHVLDGCRIVLKDVFDSVLVE